jgi:membrane-bound lytic murein transglycosylase D
MQSQEKGAAHKAAIKTTTVSHSVARAGPETYQGQDSLGAAVRGGAEGPEPAEDADAIGADESAENDAQEVVQDDEQPDTEGHISDLGGEEPLDSSAEEEVEATSVGGSVATDQKSSLQHVPIVMNDRVEWWIKYYTGQGRDRFQRHLDRADAYAPTIQSALRDAGVADSLFYIALIESGFVTRARSHAGAVGVWQFIRGTGRNYGLEVSSVIDERKDPVRATQAAARYLGDLYNIFNDWYLAFAAYNCGEYRVLRSIVKGRTRDFWELSEQKLLPKETRHYVPKFLAAMLIAKNRETYGFASNTVDPIPAVKAVDVAPGTRLADVARAANIPLEDLAVVNPHLLKKQAPRRGRSYAIWVPAHAADAVAASKIVAAVNTKGVAPMATEDEAEQDPVEFHRVARGETLGSIAREYGTSVKKLRSLNKNLTSRTVLRVGQRLKVSGPSQSLTRSRSPRSATVAKGAIRKIEASNNDFVMYRVRNGDSLNKIGRRFGVRINQIKEANALGRNHLFAGEVIRVPSGG